MYLFAMVTNGIQHKNPLLIMYGGYCGDLVKENYQNFLKFGYLFI